MIVLGTGKGNDLLAQAGSALGNMMGSIAATASSWISNAFGSEESGDDPENSNSQSENEFVNQIVGFIVPDYVTAALGIAGGMLLDVLPNIPQAGVGHHFVPISVVSEFRNKMTQAASDIAFGNYSGPTFPRHNFGTYGGVSHHQYKAIVSDELKLYMQKNGIKTMNGDQMLDFSEKMRNGLDHKGNPHPDLTAFNNGIDAERQSYLKGSKGRGLHGGRGKADYLQRGASYRARANFIKLAVGAAGASVLGAVVQQTVGALDVASKSENYRRGMEALAEGDLAAADGYFWNNPNNSFYLDLLGEGLGHAALIFKAQYIAAIQNAQIQAESLKVP